jgi:DNA invertase Pin-like site-specific DNA recombinase
MARTARRPSLPTSDRTRAVAYLRVSTDKQADRGVSLDAQRAKVEAYAALYDLDLVAVEVDAGVSASTLDRPALGRAFAMLDRGDADALLVVKLDRLTRSVGDLGAVVRRCNRSGWALLSVSEQIDTRTAAGRLVLNVLASVAEWEREAIGERTAAAMAHKRSEGQRVGAIPYGYRLASDGVHIEGEPAEQAVIAAARELHAAGLSLRKVAAELAARGFVTRSGVVFDATQVRRMVA